MFLLTFVAIFGLYWDRVTTPLSIAYMVVWVLEMICEAIEIVLTMEVYNSLALESN